MAEYYHHDGNMGGSGMHHCVTNTAPHMGFSAPPQPGFAPHRGFASPQAQPYGPAALPVYVPPSPPNSIRRNACVEGVICICPMRRSACEVVTPPDAIRINPIGIKLQETFFGDTPAPFECQYCDNSGLTSVRSEQSVSSYAACMMCACIGICFLFPQGDCLWHKFHYCPHCGQKVGDFTKPDPCLVVHPTQWTRSSFGVPKRQGNVLTHPNNQQLY